MTKSIQLFKPVYNIEEILREIRECLETGWTGNGFKTVQFEDKFKEFTGVENAHFLNSATSGLHLALEIIKIIHSVDKGVVLTTPLTFISDTHVIKHAHLTPVFVDINDSLCMDPIALEATLRLHNPVAVIYVGMGGNTGNLKDIVDVCKLFKVPLIFDASHCMGTYYRGNHVGSEADYTVFSFHSVKNLPTADSGMLVCKSFTDDFMARRLSWLGINKSTFERQTRGGNWDYNVDFVGYKYHGNSIMAAIALAQLKILRSSNVIRRMQADRYDENLKPQYKRIKISEGCIPSRHLYQVLVYPNLNRDHVIKQARDRGIQLGVHYKYHGEYPMYADAKYFCPLASIASKELISLPIGPHLTEKDVDYIVETLNEIKF